MFLKIKSPGIVVGVYHGDQPPVDNSPGAFYIPVEQVAGADAVMSNGMAAWDFALSCAAVAPVWVSEAGGQYSLTVDVADIQAAIIARLKDATYQTIVRKMPEWRQARWNEYATLYEQAQAGGQFTARQQMIFEAMIDPGDTAESTYNEVMTALSWIHACIAAHNTVESAILAIKDPVEAIQFTGQPEYPAWVG